MHSLEPSALDLRLKSSMSLITRSRLLLLCAVLCSLAAVFFATERQRGAVRPAIAVLETINLLKGTMVDQETGLRGYVQTRREAFLKPYFSGQRGWKSAVERARRQGSGDRKLAQSLERQIQVGQEWQRSALTALKDLRRGEQAEIPVKNAIARQRLMDRFRTDNQASYEIAQKLVDQRLKSAQREALAGVMAVALYFALLALWLVERRRRKEQKERDRAAKFTLAMQHALDVSRATQLLTDRIRDISPDSTVTLEWGQLPHQRVDKDRTRTIGLPLVMRGSVTGWVEVETKTEPSKAQLRGIEQAVVQAGPALTTLRDLAYAQTASITDSLTELPNARGVQSALEHFAAEARRLGQPLAAIVLDADHFKSINDEFGHQAGDDALAAIGRAIRSQIRRTDFAGRWGGEEFVVLLPDADAARATQVAQKIRAAISNANIASVPRRITASAGLAVFPAHATNVGELIFSADHALYEAKNRGRDQVVVCTRKASKAAIENDVRLEAVDRAAAAIAVAHEIFDPLVEQAALLTGAPSACLTLVRGDRQIFAVHRGLRDDIAKAGETPISHSFCATTVSSGSAVIAEDATQHPLLTGNPAIEDFDALSYAGMPIYGPQGDQLGALCAIDSAIRPWTIEQVTALQELAVTASAEIAARSANAAECAA